jgi:hypothetical protein
VFDATQNKAAFARPSRQARAVFCIERHKPRPVREHRGQARTRPMCWTARPVVRCVARSSGTRGSISATAASFDAPFSLSWRVIQRQKQHTRSAAQCAPSTRAAGISGTDNEQTKRKQGSARATTRDDARERRILIKENGGYSRQVGSIARRARAHLHERTSTTEEQSGSPRRLQDAQSTQRPARRTTSLPLSGRGVWFSQYARPTRHWPLFASATARLGVAFCT